MQHTARESAMAYPGTSSLLLLLLLRSTTRRIIRARQSGGEVKMNVETRGEKRVCHAQDPL
jgi:hypothetical protein